MPDKIPMLPLFNSFADIDFKEPKIKKKESKQLGNTQKLLDLTQSKVKLSSD